MEYFKSRTVYFSYDQAIDKVAALLKEEDFGVLTEIDVKDTLNKKLNVDFKKYKIFGACNPNFDHTALQAEDKIGVMPPSNILVEKHDDEAIEDSAVNLIASMQAVNNNELHRIAGQVRDKLNKLNSNL